MLRTAESSPVQELAAGTLLRGLDPADALRLSEERFRALVDTIPAAVFMYGDNKTSYVNPAAVRISGYSREELLDMNNFWQLVHPDSRAELLHNYLAHLRGDTIPTQYEVRILTKQGESRWVLFTFDWVTIGDERLVLLGTAIDITERKEVQDTLRSKSDQLQAVFDSFPDVLIRLDRRGTILEYTASPQVPLYRQLDVFRGRRLTSLVPDDVSALVRKAITRVTRTGKATKIEYDLRLPDGRRLFESYFMPFQVDEVLVLARDVTERNLAEEALRRSETRHRALYQDNPSMYFTVAPDGTVLSVNDFGAGNLGYTTKELEGKSVLKVFHPRDREAAKQHLADCLAGSPRTAVWQLRKVRKDGTVIWVEERARTSRDAEGNPIVLVVCEDVTERHAMEDNLRESESRLRAFAHAVPDLAFILDETGRYVEVLGLPQEKSEIPYKSANDLPGKRLHDVLPKKSADRFLAVIRRTIRTEKPQVLEYELNVSSRQRWFEGRTAPLPVRGRPRMVVWLAHDITARKAAEQALVTLREELDRKAEQAARRGVDHGLTFRELTVLQLIVAGKSDKEIGLTLGISPLTANKHVGNIMRKMKVRSRTSASVIALRDGLVS